MLSTRHAPCSTLLSALCVVCIASHARGIVEEPVEPEPHPVSEPGPLSDAIFGAVAVGEFTGDLDRDAIVLDDGVPTLLISPETLSTSLRAPVEGVDLATLPHGVTAGHDSVLLVGPAGLHALRWVPLGEGSFGWDVELVDAASWAGARAVAVGRFGGVDDGDVAGLTADGGSVVTRVRDVHGVYAPGPTLALAAPAHDLFVLDFDGDGFDDVAAVTAVGLHVLDLDGATLKLLSLPTPILAVAVGDAEHAAERIVVATRVASEDYLWVVGLDGGEHRVEAGDVGINALAAWDHDGDGDDDVVTFLDTDVDLRRYTYRSPGQAPPGQGTFHALDVTSLVCGDPLRDPAANAAGSGVADFDHDGLLDLLAPMQGDWTPATGGVHGEVVWLASGVAQLTNQSVHVIDAVLEPYGSAPYQQYELIVDISQPGALLPGAGQQRRLQLTVWTAPDPGGPTDAEPYRSTVFLSDETTELSLLLPSTAIDDDDVYAFVMREALVDVASGAAVAVGPAVVATYCGEATYPLLIPHPDMEYHFEVDANTGTITSQPGGGMVIGPTPPDFDDDVAPRPGN